MSLCVDIESVDRSVRASVTVKKNTLPHMLLGGKPVGDFTSKSAVTPLLCILELDNVRAAAVDVAGKAEVAYSPGTLA